MVILVQICSKQLKHTPIYQRRTQKNDELLFIFLWFRRQINWQQMVNSTNNNNKNILQFAFSAQLESA